MNKEYRNIILAHLKEVAEKDSVFAEKLDSFSNSETEAIFKHILSEARKLGNAVCVKDEVVYGWAIHFVDEIETYRKGQKGRIEKQKEDIEKITREREQLSEKLKEEKQKDDKKSAVSKLTDKKPKGEKAVQLSLFDLYDF